MDKDKPLPVKYLDSRTVDRYVRRGLVDEKERARLLKALPDLADSCVKVETEFDGSGELGPAS